MSTEQKTLEQRIEDILKYWKIDHTKWNLVVDLANLARESKRSGWVKVSAGSPVAYKRGNFDGLQSDIVLAYWSETETYRVARTYQGAMDGHQFCQWCDSEDFELLPPDLWQPIRPPYTDETLASPQPDAEKDQRIAELEKELRKHESRENFRRVVHESGAGPDNKYYGTAVCDALRDQIQQLESQLKERDDEAKTYYDLLMTALGKSEPTKTYTLEEFKTKLDSESQLQASKPDAEKLADKILELSKHDFMLNKGNIIKAIQSIK